MAAVLRLFRLGHQSLWVDEIITWYSATASVPMTLSRLLENVHGPLYSLMLHAWCSVAGESEWALRLPSALMGIALVPAIAWLSGRWLGRSSAAPAAWLTAGSPFLVWYAQEARNYSMLMLAAAIASAVLVGLRERLTARGTLGYVMAAAAGLLSNFSFALLAPVHLRWWLGERGERRRRLLLAGAAALVLLVALLPWVSHIRTNWDWRRLHPDRAKGAGETALRGGTTFHPGAIPFALHSFAVGYTLGPPLRELRADSSLRTLKRHAPELATSALVFGTLSVLGLIAMRRRRRLSELLLWTLPAVLIVSYFGAQNFKTFHPRYLAVLMPALIALWAAALADLGRAQRIAMALAVAGLWMVSLAHLYADDRYAKDDLRSAARVIAERGRSGEVVIAANTVELLVYYYRGALPVRHYWLGFVAQPDSMAVRFEHLKGSGASWVLLSRPEDLDPHGAFARYLDARYPSAERWRFAGVRLWRLPSEVAGAETKSP